MGQAALKNIGLALIVGCINMIGRQRYSHYEIGALHYRMTLYLIS